MIFASIFKKKPANYALICNNQYSAQKTYEFLLNFLKEEDVAFFPADELLRAESLSSSRELMAQRLYAMGQITNGKPHILITHPSALLRFQANPEEFKSSSFTLKIGDVVNLAELKVKLAEMGYSRVNKVDQSLQFASRGDILDIYSVNFVKPIRIEFFGDEVDSIKEFDIATQTSKDKLDTVTVYPASDMYMSDDRISELTDKIRDRLKADAELMPMGDHEELSGNVMRDLEDIVSRNYKPSLYRYYGFGLKKPYSILSYFSPEIAFVADREGFATGTEMLKEEAERFYGELFQARNIITRLSHYMSPKDAFRDAGRIVYGTKFQKYPTDTVFNVRTITTATTGIAGFIPLIQSYMDYNKKVVIAVSDDHQIGAIKSFLDNVDIAYEDVEGYGLPLGHLGIAREPLNVGFEIQELSIAYISASEIFGKRAVSSRFTSRFKEATILKNYDDLRPGDYVVHETYGIGQFVEIKMIEKDGVRRDYLRIAYAGDETLYVPLEQFRLVRKYSGREGASPRLSHLFSGDWKKRKEKIKEKLNDLAERLLNLYSERAKVDGFAFPEDDELQIKFEEEFPYELTADQAKSLREIKDDMESNKVMDRLLCGDVGFGKTEIAMRAAFKAISAGKQVAILCPTTLLARQHYELALQRFATFGIHISHMSRLVPPSIQKLDIEEIKNGKMDLVIGTHRLLSKSVSFKDLGLLIIDEEQRFGVEQKEKIKALKRNVDVLTLSATPIPRTMQMSLVGIRPLSEINTAPSVRMPIQTYVTPFKEDVVYELIQRELTRQGQVFYVHNYVASIYNVAANISSKVQGASVGVVHGKMTKDEIEDVMTKFYDGSVNVLIATSIVENGIDVPNANMIIVEDADRFGLSQLYQIKGRVGRGDKIAYAYLMYKPQKNMNEDAQKRLKAIQDFTELGSGYKIAQRDLMIRGAGDILGAEQAGFIDSIGLDLYLKMLNETIEEKKTGITKEPPKPKRLLSIDAYIPEEFAGNGDKLELYSDLENAESEEEIDGIVAKMRDIYGKLPSQAERLIQKKRIDVLSSQEEIALLEEAKDRVDITLSDKFSTLSGIGNELFSAIVPYIRIVKVTFLDKKLKIKVTKRDKWVDDIESILRIIHKVYASHKLGGATA
ncbi:MAG: transcription-repair coupling factor [Bacilli bacterium]|nr:transcription-repair coupling factor [Bacilli bacterium]